MKVRKFNQRKSAQYFLGCYEYQSTISLFKFDKKNTSVLTHNGFGGYHPKWITCNVDFNTFQNHNSKSPTFWQTIERQQAEEIFGELPKNNPHLNQVTYHTGHIGTANNNAPVSIG